jgi:UPF0755 protein
MSYETPVLSRRKIILLVLVALAVIISTFYLRFLSPPESFPTGSVIRIEEGETLTQVAENFNEDGLVRSSQWLSNLVILLQGESGVIAGDYFFKESENAFKIALRITKGDSGLEPIKVTLPEGLMRSETARILADRLPRFNIERFMDLTEDREGYLFPETYFFLPTADEDVVASRLSTSFEIHIDLVADDIERFGRPLDEVIVMASIIEEEAADAEDRMIVSGILWKRIEIGMPLQVDASFLAINGKTSAELTVDDLAIDSPYNTYRYRGLPPNPISSPGLESILAAVNPIETEYLYFLSDSDGRMHYAEDLDGHNENKDLYID